MAGAKAFIGSLWDSTFGGPVNDAIQVWGNTADQGMSTVGRIYTAAGTGVASLVGVRQLSDAGSDRDAVDGHLQSPGERVLKGATGGLQLATTAAGIGGLVKGILSNLGTKTAAGTLDASVANVAPNSPRAFSSSDPLVADLANKIEAANPGHVVGVNVPIRNAAGELVTDADILLQNAAIQVKSGGGKGLAAQLVRTEEATGLPTIGYGPTLKPSVVKNIQNSGGLVTKDEALLLEVVKP